MPGKVQSSGPCVGLQLTDLLAMPSLPTGEKLLQLICESMAVPRSVLEGGMGGTYTSLTEMNTQLLGKMFPTQWSTS